MIKSIVSTLRKYEASRGYQITQRRQTTLFVDRLALEKLQEHEKWIEERKRKLDLTLE